VGGWAEECCENVFLTRDDDDGATMMTDDGRRYEIRRVRATGVWDSGYFLSHGSINSKHQSAGP
jgi:hypothetical protein